MWGKLLEKRKCFYKGKEKIKEEIEFRMAYPSSEIGGGKGKGTYTYEYNGQQLLKLFYNKKPIEEYKYDKGNNQIERRITNELNVPEYYRFFYSNNLKVKSQYFVEDTIGAVDTFIYDKDKRLTEKLSYDSKGLMSGYRVIIRNDKGEAIQEKWRTFYEREIVENNFYNVNQDYYDNNGRLLKTEFYFGDKLTTIYEFRYE